MPSLCRRARVWGLQGARGGFHFARDKVGPASNPRLRHTASFAAFTGRTLRLFRAGFALNAVGSFVNGLMPARSLVAGFLMTTNLAKPGSRKVPVFFNS